MVPPGIRRAWISGRAPLGATRVILVSDNGPAYKATGFDRYIASRPELRHVRTRKRSPHTNGVLERFFGSAKYEHLYREEIEDGVAFDAEVRYFLDVFNRIRPHEELAFERLGNDNSTWPHRDDLIWPHPR